ncbi:MAG: CAP domain-containing protein, partial [Mariniphaga sp.]
TSNSQTKQSASGNLSKLEQEVFAELNLARTQPKTYAKFLVEYAKHYSGMDVRFPEEVTMTTNEGVAAVNEAIKFLNTQKPLQKLTIDKGLCLSAKDMARMQGATSQIGHVGTDGSSPTTRLVRQGDWDGLCIENIDYGNNNARRIVISMIVNDGIKARTFRKSIFEPKYRQVGVACGPHQAYEYMCVVDYAEDFRDK